MKMRAYNQPFMDAMTAYSRYIMNAVSTIELYLHFSNSIVQVQPYLPSNGGNVMLAQIEDEYWQGDVNCILIVNLTFVSQVSQM